MFGAVPGIPGRVGRGCVPGIPGRDIKPGPCFRCAVFGAVLVFLGGWGVVAYVPGIPGRDITRFLFFGAVPRWIGAWLRTPGIPGRDIIWVLFLVLFLGGLGRGCVLEIPEEI